MMMIKKMIMIDNDNVYENNGYSDAFNGDSTDDDIDEDSYANEYDIVIVMMIIPMLTIDI